MKLSNLFLVAPVHLSAAIAFLDARSPLTTALTALSHTSSHEAKITSPPSLEERQSPDNVIGYSWSFDEWITYTCSPGEHFTTSGSLGFCCLEANACRSWTSCKDGTVYGPGTTSYCDQDPMMYFGCLSITIVESRNTGLLTQYDCTWPETAITLFQNTTDASPSVTATGEPSTTINTGVPSPTSGSSFNNGSSLSNNRGGSGTRGNEVAAADLYGIGVRTGIYLQVLGMTLSCFRLKSQGLKLTCAASMIAILASWTLLVRHEALSAAEAWLILTIVSMLFIPAASAVADIKSTVGEGVALFCLYIAEFWYCIAYICFWAKLYRTLPTLGTTDAAWCFAQVNIRHWFRTFMLVQGCILYIIAMALLVFTGPVVLFATGKAWLEGKSELPGLKENQIKWMQMAARGLAISGGLAWVFSIWAIEDMIRWNELVPSKDWTAPGQSIPFVIGLIVLVDGCFGVFQKKPEDDNKLHRTLNNKKSRMTRT